MDEMRIVALNGFLGYGYPLASLQAGMAAEPHMLGADAGSVDPGPHYLGSGEQLVKRSQVYRDLKPALVSACKSKTPLVIGSAGTAGGEPHLRSVLQVVYRIAQEEDLHFRLAVIHSEIERRVLLDALEEGRVRPMRGVPSLTKEAVRASARLVGQFGTEPIIEALEGDADVVVAGRVCDAAIYAALPIKEGFDAGLTFHMAKIMECGAQCAIPLAPNDCLLGILRRDHFLIQPLNPSRRVTEASVAAHSLYEQPHPFLFEEPEGTIDLSEATYELVDAHTVRVGGSRFVPRPGGTTLKIEGAGMVGYRAVAVAGARDPEVIANLDTIEGQVRTMVSDNLESGIESGSYSLFFRYYGRDAVLGHLERRAVPPPHEVGVMIEAIAPTQEAANTILALARSSFLHCPFDGRKTTAGNLAFPFSPSDIAAGPVFRFTVYHLMETDDEKCLRRLEFKHV